MDSRQQYRDSRLSSMPIKIAADCADKYGPKPEEGRFVYLRKSAANLLHF